MISRFAEPWAFAALLVIIPWLATAFWRQRRAPAVMSPVFHRAQAAKSALPALLSLLPTITRFGALVCFAFALARPQELISNSESSKDAIAMELVVDRSGSMDDPVMFEGERINRLQAVQAVVSRFVLGDDEKLTGRAGDLIGLIVFGTYADTLMPLTTSHEALVETLNAVEVARDQRERNTAIGDALMLANARLRTSEDTLRQQTEDPDFKFNSKAIVLLTDGENRAGQYSPYDAATVSKEWGVRVYIIGIRGGASQIVAGRRLPLGQEVNEREMRRVTELTGGMFWPVSDLADLPDIYARIDELERTEIRVSETTEIRELYHAPATLGLGLLAAEILLRLILARRIA
ncbi:MAG: VWA domain-containing protein [Phycisphaerales bacterium]